MSSRKRLLDWVLINPDWLVSSRKSERGIFNHGEANIVPEVPTTTTRPWETAIPDRAMPIVAVLGSVEVSSFRLAFFWLAVFPISISPVGPNLIWNMAVKASIVNNVYNISPLKHNSSFDPQFFNSFPRYKDLRNTGRLLRKCIFLLKFMLIHYSSFDPFSLFLHMELKTKRRHRSLHHSVELLLRLWYFSGNRPNQIYGGPRWLI